MAGALSILRNPAMLLLFQALFISQSSPAAAYSDSAAAARTCRVPEEATNSQLAALVRRNCDKVISTVGEFKRVVADENSAFWVQLWTRGTQAKEDAQKEAWRSQSAVATEMCSDAMDALANDTLADLEDAAELAVNAWGSVIMGGQECCTLFVPPYCTYTTLSFSTIVLACPFLTLYCMFVGSLFLRAWRDRCGCRKAPREREGAPSASMMSSMGPPAAARGASAREAPEASGTSAASSAAESAAGGGFFAGLAGLFGGLRDGITAAAVAPLEAFAAPAAVNDGELLRRELKAAWTERSSLRALPRAEEFAEATANLFVALQATLDFQFDSVRNQHEHMLSLWRSHCSMVADRTLETSDSSADSEGTLLEEALGDMHAELLEGYLRWRAKLRAYEASDLPDRSAGRASAGVAVQTPASGIEKEQESPGSKLAEVAMYLLVWGEAGNLRFMPELVYFITEMALSSQAGTLEELYPSIPTALAAGGSNLFLAAIVRPVYNKIFSEWYTHVSVDKGSGKDSKKLKKGYENFLPADVANYDDWNELFCDPHRLVRDLKYRDEGGVRRLFTKRHGERFAALSLVDWEASLGADVVKTHREVHSFWAVFGATHRMWLVHGILFTVGVLASTGEPPARSDGDEALGGETPWVRFAVLGLLSPAHAFLRTIARWQVRGSAARSYKTIPWILTTLLKFAFFATPVGTYAGVRWLHFHKYVVRRDALLTAHYVISCAGLFKLLFVPSTSERYRVWNLTPVPLRKRVMRYLFWAEVLGFKFLFGVIIFNSVHQAMVELDLAMPGRQSASDVRQLLYNPTWGANVLLWVLLWCTTFFLFLSDTQLWFTVACTVLGAATAFTQRGCKLLNYTLEDAVAKIPERFSEKVLPWRKTKEAVRFSPLFPDVWDRILEYMRYEDKIDNSLLGDLSFNAGDAGQHHSWEDVNKPAFSRKRHSEGAETTKNRVKVPDIFRNKSPVEIGVRQACVSDPNWPRNPDAQWRIIALARGLGLDMPRPFRAPHIPGLTVLIPHYGESILLTTKELYQKDQPLKPLMHWLMYTYEAEFSAFTTRMQARQVPDMPEDQKWLAAGSNWADYTPAQWSKINSWASMRMQTLWRTVAGMCLYHPALQCHFEAQGDYKSGLAKHWTPSDSFTCLVSMQMYKFFNATQFEHTNQMFDKFPDCLKMAYIDCSEKPRGASPADYAANQKRRYFSCLVDKTCPVEPDGRRTPKLRVELPGYPILGDGKGDNQNHAIPFMRGQFAQCIDANQGAYFEQMMLLPNALGEFRTRHRGGAGAKRIVGFPEHITSDIGSIGDFAASAEVAFGSILQRSYSMLGARMHYGHPDIMNKVYMMQQGGVSKATKTLNLSEDIFAGMDFTLRGQGRTIRHCEYFNLAKGRDLGFNTVLGFFSKLSSGTGEQVITRQTFRLGQVLHLPEALTFYYGHGGYYFTQFLVATSMPLLVFLWLLVIFSDCEQNFSAFQGCGGGARTASSASIMANLLGVWFSWILILFLVTTSLPLFVEVWMQRSFVYALGKYIKQLFTLSPLLFIFQGKTIGHYVVNELRFGGATYVSTGRGLPTDRRPFIGELAESGRTLQTVGGLYLDYAVIAYYDGAVLYVATILVAVVGDVASQAGRELHFVWFSLGITIASWLWAPFIFNPYQFQAKAFWQDIKCAVAFFWEDGGRHWVKWYDKTQLRLGSARPAVDSTFFIAACMVVVWYAMMNVKAEALGRIYSEFHQGQVSFNILILLPPMFASLAYCVLLVLAGSLNRCYGVLRRAHRRAQAMRTPSPPASAEGDPEDGEEDEPPVHPEDAAARPHERSVDYVVKRKQLAAAAAATPAAKPDDGSAGDERCCKVSVPLGLVALSALVLDMAEAAVFLHQLLLVGWWKAFIAGLIFKWAVFCGLVHLGEGLLRWLERPVPGFAPLFLWVRAHRMARDMLTSSLILAGILPLVLLNKLNDCLCPGLSIHHLLIYRNPNHLGKQEAYVPEIPLASVHAPGPRPPVAPPPAPCGDADVDTVGV